MTEGEPEQLVDESVRIFRGAIEGAVAEHALDEVMGILKDVLHYALSNPKLVNATVDEYPACIWLAAMLETLTIDFLAYPRSPVSWCGVCGVEVGAVAAVEGPPQFD